MGVVNVSVKRSHVIGGETFAVVVETEHEGGVVARTAVHSQDFDRRIGGARTVMQGSESEVGHLSSAMTVKCAAAHLPADGEKSLVVMGGPLPDRATRIRLLAEHLGEVKQADAGVIFGPDMNNGEAVMDGLARTDGLLDHATGLSDAEGGISIDTHGFTAVGLDEGVAVVSDLTHVPLRTATIQGYGAVGAHMGRLLAERGIRVSALNFKGGTFIADGDEGLDQTFFFRTWQDGGDDALTALAGDLPNGVQFDADPNAILTVKADIFVPAARTEVFATADELPESTKENPDCRDIAVFLQDTGVRLIVEGANHPLSDDAVRYAETHGAIVLKDYIVNCGGLIGCYVEWAYRDELRASPEEVPAMRDKALRMVRQVVRHNIARMLKMDGSVLENAHAIAMENRERLLERRRESDLGDHAFAQACLEEHLTAETTA
ncbi:MAG: Glu/Leu/Phe/Val dehydrogenase dimerization domain-containing protein [Planctomycetota bacterium]|nr:Glu/Leu/Phe/Val dehydrogenase dimerization domain-containing protein [Planctomycetota bacterium]